MIYTDAKKLGRYLGISQNLDTAINYLRTHDLARLATGRNEVDGDNVYINRFDYTTIDETDAFYEAHLNYADIHILLSGEEIIKIADVNALKEFERDEATDYIGFHGEAQSSCEMSCHKVLVVFPEDAHMVKLKLHEASLVQKVVVKVKM